MGYRSDVAIAIDKRLYMKYETLAGMLPKMLKDSERKENDKAFYWFFSNIKWSEFIPEIQEINRFIGILEKDQDDNADMFKSDEYIEYGYAYVRLGEDIEDNMFEADYEVYGLEIVREIDTPFGMFNALQGLN